MTGRILRVPYRSHYDVGAAFERRDDGPACLSMILAAAGRRVTPAAIAAHGKSTSGAGLSPYDLMAVAKAADLGLSLRTGQNLAALKSLIDQGCPPIALVDYARFSDRWDGGYDGGYYVVVVGYDDHSGRVFVNDPGYPPGAAGYQRPYAYAEFQQAWSDFAAANDLRSALLVPSLNSPVAGTPLATPLSDSTAPSEPTAAWICAREGADLLDRPHRQARAIGHVVFAQRVTILGTARTAPPRDEGPFEPVWLHIASEAGSEGWLSATDTSREPQISRVPPRAPRIAQVRNIASVRDAGGLSLRRSRSINTEPVERIPVGAHVSLYDTISHESGTRWAQARSPLWVAGYIRENIGNIPLIALLDLKQVAGADRTRAMPLDFGARAPALPGAPVWVIAPAGLVLRGQPSGLSQRKESVPFGQRLFAVGPPGTPDATGRMWQQVRTDSGVTGHVVTQHRDERYLSDVEPAAPYVAIVLDTPPTRARSGLGVYERHDLGAPVIERVEIGGRLRVFGRIQIGTQDIWLWVQSPRGQYGWLRERAGDVTLVGPAGNGAAPTPDRPSVLVEVRPFAKCLTGVGMGEPQLPTRRQIDLIGKSQVEAFKMLTLPSPEHTTLLLNQIRGLPSIQLIVARLFFSVDAVRRTPFSAEDFVGTVTVGMQAAYDAGVRYFEIHNEPNHANEGLGWNWRGGAEFGAWLIQVVARLRQSFPDARLGFPGLSPQPNVQAFLDGAAQGLAQCDWLGAHSYWHTVEGGTYPMTATSAGMHWQLYRNRYPDKLIMITEFSNNSPDVDPAEKARQYGRYFQLLRQEPGLGAAFAFALTWPGQDMRSEAWESGGIETPIAKTLGALLDDPTYLDKTPT